jgi:hypothetical protein
MFTTNRAEIAYQMGGKITIICQSFEVHYQAGGLFFVDAGVEISY